MLRASLFFPTDEGGKGIFEARLSDRRNVCRAIRLCRASSLSQQFVDSRFFVSTNQLLFKQLRSGLKEKQPKSRRDNLPQIIDSFPVVRYNYARFERYQRHHRVASNNLLKVNNFRWIFELGNEAQLPFALKKPF